MKQPVQAISRVVPQGQWWGRIKTALAILMILVFVFYGYLAMQGSKTLLSSMGSDTALTESVRLQELAEANVAVDKMPKTMASVSPTWMTLMASVTSSRYTYSADSLWKTEMYYVAMPSSHKIILSAHMALGGLCMVLGAFQFWPAFRRKRPLLHRRMGMVYAVSAQIAMLFAMTYLLLTPVANIYSTLVFAVGLWVLAISVTFSLWMSIYHIMRREVAQHQAWMAMNFGFLLTAPLLRYDWALLGLAMPSLSQAEANFSAMVFLIPQSFLMGYALLCMNRAQQKDRRVAQSLPITARMRKWFPVWGSVSLLMLLGAASGTLQYYWLTPGMAASEFAQKLVPAGVVALDTQLMASATVARALFTVTSLLIFAMAACLLFVVFRHEQQSAHQQTRTKTLGLIMAMAGVINAVIQFRWGYALGAPSYTQLSGGTFYVLNALILLPFSIALAWAAVTDRQALLREWAIFTALAAMAAPSFFGALVLLNIIGIPAVYVASGHGYMLAASSGSIALLLGFAYSAYGLATREKVPA